MSPLVLFIIKAASIYAGWQVLYDVYILPDGRLDTILSLSGVKMAGEILSIIGMEVEITGRVITCIGHKGVEIQNGCNGLNLLGLYSGFIIAYPGRWKDRLIFLMTGLIVLFISNGARIAFFAFFNTWLPHYFDTMHDLSSYFFFYPIVLIFWYSWIQVSEEKQLLNFT